MTNREREIRRIVQAAIKDDGGLSRDPARRWAVESGARFAANLLLDRIDRLTNDVNRAPKRAQKGSTR